tara:strand:- start:2900 stop:3121 length:222 start_codon:yes stop_codon:yes gene_type:complete
MKWMIMFLICGPEICSTYIGDTRYMSKEHCQMMSKQFDAIKTFNLTENDNTIAQYCLPEAELSHLTDRVVEDL